MSEESTETEEGQPGSEKQGSAGAQDKQAPVLKVDHLPEDIRADGSLKPHIADDGTVDFAGLAKSHVHAQQMIGRDKVVIPKEGDDAETWNQFFRVLGRPDTPDAYEWPDLSEDAPDVALDEQWVGEFGKWAHDLGLSNSQAQGLMSRFARQTQYSMEQSQAALKGAQDQAMAELRREHGAATDEVVSGAQEVLRTFSDEDFLDWVDASGLGDDPRFINFLSGIKKQMSEDVFGTVQRRASGQGLAPADAKSRLAELKSDPAYMDAKDPRHKTVMQQIDNLYTQAYPEEAGIVAVTREQVRAG